MRQHNARLEAKLAVISQMMVVVALFMGEWMLAGLREALSFLVGGLIAFLPNVYLYKRLFFHFAGCPKRILHAFFRGQAVKWLLVAVGFLLATQIAWVLPLVLFFGFISAQIGFYVLPLGLTIKRLAIKKAIKEHSVKVESN